MAKVLLRPEILGISGRVGNMIFKTRGDKVYLHSAARQPRSTPVTAGELERREKFRRATQTAFTLSPEDLRAYGQAMRRTLGKYNGKVYVSVRGYVIARLYNNDPL